LGGNLSLNNGFINFNSNNQNNKLDKNIIKKADKKDWPELYWNNKKSHAYDATYEVNHEPIFNR